MFSRVLVANRGEIAVRVIRALHELGLEAVAVYSTADADAAARPARRPAVCIGPPPRAESYLRIPNVIAAAETTGCEAVHPGYGFLAENPAFARACAENDLVFVGPAARGDGADWATRRGEGEMRAAGVPLVPGTDGAASLEEIGAPQPRSGSRCCSRRPPGGGGKGMRLVDDARRAGRRLRGRGGARPKRRSATARSTSRRSSSPARHVEIQVLCDAHGGVLTLGERECSIQRRHQKLIEESPSPALDARDARGDGGRRSSARAAAVGYENAGTFEFLLGAGGRAVLHRGELPPPGRASGLASSSPGSTSCASSCASPQASRWPSTGRAPRRGHAIEVRINAEDPARDFAPAPGRDRAVPAAARPGRPRRHAPSRTGPRSRRTTTR